MLRLWTPVLVAACFWASDAGACIEELRPERASPKDGATDVPLDSAVVVQFGTSGHPCSLLDFPGIEVTVTASSGGLLAGSLAEWNPTLHCGAAGDALVWRPLAPYDPGAVYDVNVTFTDYEIPPPISYQATFTTGTALLPEVSLQGTFEHTVSVETETIEWCNQPDGCGSGGGCVSEEQTYVSVRLFGLSATGGQAKDGYDVFLVGGTDQPPAQSEAHTSTHVAENQAIQFQYRLVDTKHPYTPCFSVFVRDAAGHLAQASTCLPALDPGALLAERSPTPTSGSDDSGGCSVTRAHKSRSWLVGLVVVFALLWRRARSKTSTPG